MEALGSRSLGLRTKVLPQAMAIGEHPHGDHGGEVEGRDAGDDAEGLAHGVAVDAGADLLCEFALEKLWNAGGELDDLEAAGGFALGVGEDLAVLAVDERGDLVEAALEDLAEAEEDAGAAQRRLGGPLREGGGGGGDGGVDLGAEARGTRDCTRPEAGWKTSEKRPEVPATRAPEIQWVRSVTAVFDVDGAMGDAMVDMGPPTGGRNHYRNKLS